MESTDIIHSALERYAQRGVFKGYGALGKEGGKHLYRVRWHYDSDLRIVFDGKTSTLSLPKVFPRATEVPRMLDALRAYVKRKQDQGLPDHRRIDGERAQVRLVNRGGDVTLSLKSLDGDIEYAVQKLVHLMNEIFIDFLRDGAYYEYLVAEFGAEADPM